MIDEIVSSISVDVSSNTIDIRRFSIFLYNSYIFSLDVDLFSNIIVIAIILEIFEECIYLDIVVVVSQLSFTFNLLFNLKDQIF